VAALSKDRQVSTEKGWGSGNLALKVNGKIFAMLVKGKLVAKLPKARVDELVSTGAGDRFGPRGDDRLMKEWLVVGIGRGNWIALAAEAHGFVKDERRAHKGEQDHENRHHYTGRKHRAGPRQLVSNSGT
jgi:hypothetical protein